MSKLDDAVKDLAIALDDLNSKIAARQATISKLKEVSDATRDKIGHAQTCANNAATDLSGIVSDLNTLISNLPKPQ